MLRASWNGRSGRLEICRGTNLAINYISKFSEERKQAPIGMGHEPNLYFALFKEDDVDFEISIDNTECKFRDAAFDLDINDEAIYPFLQPQGSSGVVHVVDSGHKLHFRRRRRLQSSEDEHDSPFREKPVQEEPKIMVHRIKFTVQYSKMKSPLFQIFIKMKLKTLTIDAQPTMTVEELKELIMEKKKIPQGLQMMLHFEMKFLVDKQTLQHYKIVHGSTVQLVWKIYQDSQNGQSLKDKAKGVMGDLGKNSVQNTLQPVPFDPDETIKVETFVIDMKLSTLYPVISGE